MRGAAALGRRPEFSVLAMSLVAPAVKFVNTLHLQEWADAGGEPGQAGKALIYLARCVVVAAAFDSYSQLLRCDLRTTR